MLARLALALATLLSLAVSVPGAYAAGGHGGGRASIRHHQGFGFHGSPHHSYRPGWHGQGWSRPGGWSRNRYRPNFHGGYRDHDRYAGHAHAYGWHHRNRLSYFDNDRRGGRRGDHSYNRLDTPQYSGTNTLNGSVYSERGANGTYVYGNGDQAGWRNFREPNGRSVSIIDTRTMRNPCAYEHNVCVIRP